MSLFPAESLITENPRFLLADSVFLLWLLTGVHSSQGKATRGTG